MAQEGTVSPAGLALWYQRFARAVRLPAVLAGYLTSDLGLATSSDPAAEIAIWLKARGASLTELVDVDGFTVVPGAQANWFIGLAAADPDGQKPGRPGPDLGRGDVRRHAPRRPRTSPPVARDRRPAMIRRLLVSGDHNLASPGDAPQGPKCRG
jgi:hypothetical protein